MGKADLTVNFDEEALFSRLMEEYGLDYGEELLRKNAELKTEDSDNVSAITYVRCRERIRREFAAVRRHAAARVLKITSAVACALVILGGSVLLAVPTLHDAVFGRTETVEPMPLPGQHDMTPAFRRSLPPTPTPTPEPTPTPTPEHAPYDRVVTKFSTADYYGNEIVVDGFDAYLAAQTEKYIREYYAYMIRNGGDPQKYNYDLNYGRSQTEPTIVSDAPTVVDKEITHRSMYTRP